MINNLKRESKFFYINSRYTISKLKYHLMWIIKLYFSINKKRLSIRVHYFYVMTWLFIKIHKIVIIINGVYLFHLLFGKYQMIYGKRHIKFRIVKCLSGSFIELKWYLLLVIIIDAFCFLYKLAIQWCNFCHEDRYRLRS